MSGIIRVKKKRNPFVTIDKTPLLDKRLSWKARGIMAYLLTKPDDWQVNTANLVNASEKDGRETVYSALRELEENGYITRYQIHDEHGRFGKWEILIFETPEDADEWRQGENPGKPDTAEPDTGKPDTAEPDTGKPDTAEPDTGKPDTAEPDTANPQQLINESPLINDLEIPPYVPPAGGEQEEEQEGVGNASLKDEEQPGISKTPSLCYKAQEDASEEEQIDSDVDQISAPLKPPESLSKRSGLSNMSDVAAQVFSDLRDKTEVRGVVPPIPKPKLIATKSEGNWVCPGTAEECLEFMKWEAQRLVDQKWCSAIEAEQSAENNCNKHPEKAAQRFQKWQQAQQAQQRRQEQPSERDKQPLPDYHRYSKEQHQALITEYRELGLAEFVRRDALRRYWIKEIRNNRKHISLLTPQELKELRSVEY